MDTEIETIKEIMKNYSEEEWLGQCQKALPKVEEKALLTMFEMFSSKD